MKPYEFGRKALRIREPSLPRPWIHCLSNGTPHAFTSQAHCGIAWGSNRMGTKNPKHGWAHVTHIAANRFLPGIRPKRKGVEVEILPGGGK